MDKNTIVAYVAMVAFLVVEILKEWYSPIRNKHLFSAEIIILIGVIIIGICIFFSSKIVELISKVPDSLSFLKKLLVKVLDFVKGPIPRVILFVIIVVFNFFPIDFFGKLLLSIILIVLFLFELRQKHGNLMWTQNKRPIFQDGFNDGLDKWNIVSGNRELEANFGDPAPDVLLKQVGKPAGTPQTFLILKDINIKKPSIVECEVYVEPKGIFNLIFGISNIGNSYFMARLDSRETEFDSLLFKSNNELWNFIVRSDKHRTTPKNWYRAKLEIVSDHKVNFYKNGELILSRELENGSTFGQIGIMNEEADVHIDNVVITEINK